MAAKFTGRSAPGLHQRRLLPTSEVMRRMGLFKADLYRSFAIGFVLGAVLLATLMSSLRDRPLAGPVIPAATAAAPALPDQTLVAPAKAPAPHR